MEHDLFVAVVAVDGFCASLSMSHIQPSPEAGSTQSHAQLWFSTKHCQPFAASEYGVLPFKVVKLNFFSQKFQEFYKSWTLFAVTK